MGDRRSALLMGYGMQGRGALYDLLKFGRFDEIRVLDKNPELGRLLSEQDAGAARLVPLNVDIVDQAALREAMSGVDIVICLLPRDFALPMAELAVEVGVHYACASYLGSFSSDPDDRANQRKRLERLHSEAERKGLTVLVQFGLDPGLDLLLAGEAVRRFDEVKDFCSYGAGFPELAAADNPLKYKFTWTVEGVMRSYYRPARVIRDGHVVEIPPERIFFEENTHLLNIDELGAPLECFPNGDSVSFAESLGVLDSVRNFGRFVCRWEGHCAFWRVLVNSGFMRERPVLVGGKKIGGIPFLAALFSSEPQFSYRADERDVTLTRVDVRGLASGREKREVFQIVDRRDLETGFTSMTRTVGFVLSLGAQMVLDGEVGRLGVVSPTELPYSLTVEKLARRGIHVDHRVF
jgi:lysine 6-dehydrogenase